jgi:lipid II isoglutaminyl synthase (glutamine-hydrolysing)
LCPSCGAILHRAGRDWSCECGVRRPDVSWALDHGALVDPQGDRHPIELALPGTANQANAVMAVVAADALGVPVGVALAALRSVVSVGGRYQVVSLGGRRVRLLLGKNPAGWGEMFGMLAPAPSPVVIAINARAADGKDPSWLWDVPFEKLADRLVVATGERRHDLAVRLLYAGVEHITVEDPWGAFPARLGDAGLPDRAPLDAVGTYTAFREMLRRGGGADDAV